MEGTAAEAQTADVQLYAAGSLHKALTEVERDFDFETASGHKVVLTFGASGLLRGRIEQGEPAQAGRWSAPQVFARNLMCVLAAPSVNAIPETLLDTLLQPAIRLGTSTPKADPSGDYAWALFRRADALHPGAFAVLDAKALKLTGAAGHPLPGRSADRAAGPRRPEARSARHPQGHRPADRQGRLPGQFFVRRAVQQRPG